MERTVFFESIWKKHPEVYDAIIYVPHSSLNPKYIKKVRETSKVDLSSISDEILYKYLYHEADTGVMEIVAAMKKHFTDSDYSIGILTVDIPRGFCDLNRVPNVATPEVLEDDFWKKIYTEADIEVMEILKQTEFVFQFHSMNSFNPIEKSVFDDTISEDFIRNHIEKVYSGSKRNCTLLTETDKQEYITDKKFDTIVQDNFKKHNIVLEENTAYRLLDLFPATQIIRNKKSSLFEITKGALATEHTKNEFDSNKIIFDTEKIEFFAQLFSEILQQYFYENNKKQ